MLMACANAIEKKHPRFLLMENVKALTQKKFSADFRRWRKWLIKQGYTNYYAVLNAKDYGVPQNRERVFMVSFRREHTPYTFPKPFELVRRLKHVLEDVVDEKYWLKQERIQALIKHNERKQSEGCGFKTNFQTGEGISGSIKTNAITSVQKDSMVAEPRVIQVGNLIEDSNYKNPHRGRVYSIEGIAPCLNCNEGGQREVKILQRGHGYAKGGFFDIAPALTTSKWQDNNFAVIEYWIRKLTPRECFRLMDVPEHHINRLLNAGISNSQLYKLAGNSIVVACLYHIFRKMFCETAREYGAPTAHSQEIPDVQQLSLF